MQQNYQEFLANNGRECVLSDKNNRVANNKYLNEIEIETTKTNQTIFTYDNQIIDIQELESKNIDTLNSKLYFMGIELTGGTESSNPLSQYFFGELDKDNTIKQDTPTYHFSPKDEENNLGTLLIFLNASTLTLLNYSLIDSTLNIKLELTNKESKEILEREQIQREQTQRDSNSIDSLASTAMLHPILEDNEIKCPHGGVVQLKSNLGKSIQDKNIPFILETDLLYSSIVGCPNPPLSGGPCTQVALILPHSRGLKKHNGDYPIMQDLVSSGVFSDKGVPLICIPKENSYKKIA
ncbi:hypothetical protein [uncultured Helicobacter sp.]|uniref:hypothetical protein n=1 Tax=uncultured Helicobacter sp. TaxID=175537 RepID=UPI00260659F7|nr:hypothetical protein [uncultured Helicobacter sp.]